jgi:hypothetical protein
MKTGESRKMNLNALTDLYRHMEWADASVWRAVHASAEARADQKLRDYFYHLHLVQRAFLRAWRGEPRDKPYPTFDDLRELMAWGRSYFGEVFEHFETLNEKQISQPAQLPWADLVEKELGRKPESLSVAEMIIPATAEAAARESRKARRWIQAQTRLSASGVFAFLCRRPGRKSRTGNRRGLSARKFSQCSQTTTTTTDTLRSRFRQRSAFRKR